MARSQKALRARTDGAFDLYDDTGDGYVCERGKYAATSLRWVDKAGHLTLSKGFILSSI